MGDSTMSEIWRALDIVEMSDLVHRLPMGLQTIVQSGVISDGQQQRLLIARALLEKPALLILDEATNAIPDEMQARIIARVRELGIGCVVVSHRESMIALADRVHWLDRGNLAFSGSPRDLLARRDLAAALQAERVA